MIEIFNRDEFVATFARTFLAEEADQLPGGEREANALMKNQFFNRLSVDCLESLPVYVAHLQNVKAAMEERWAASDVWQLKIVEATAEQGLLKDNPAERIRAQQMGLEMKVAEVLKKDQGLREKLKESFQVSEGEFLKWLEGLKEGEVEKVLFLRQFVGSEYGVEGGFISF